MERVKHLHDPRPHFLESVQCLVALFDTFGIYAQLLLGCLELKAPFLDKIMDLGDLVDVGRRVEAGGELPPPGSFYSSELLKKD